MLPDRRLTPRIGRNLECRVLFRVQFHSMAGADSCRDRGCVAHLRTRQEHSQLGFVYPEADLLALDLNFQDATGVCACWCVPAPPSPIRSASHSEQPSLQTLSPSR